MDIWKHGKYVDMWSTVHFLSGVVLAMIFYKLEYTLPVALVLSVVALLAWELFEWSVKILEPTINVFMDIVIGMGGFFVGAYVYYFLGKAFEIEYFILIVSITLLLSAWGFIDFLKRGYR